MSYNNHDKDDPNGVRYHKTPKINRIDQKGFQIKLWGMAINMPLGDFINWMDENYTVTSKKDSE